MTITLCGPECASCAKAEKVVNEARAAARILPGVVAGGGVTACVGKVPSVEDVQPWLK